MNKHSVYKKILENKILFKGVKKIIKKQFLVPCYHVVSDYPLIHIKNLYPIVNKKKFIKDIDFLLKEYDPIDPLEAVDLLKKNIIPKNKFFMTFDDGYRECYEEVSFILKAKGIPAIFFLTTDFINNNKLAIFNKISILLELIKKEKISKLIEIENLLKKNNLFNVNIYNSIRKLKNLNEDIVNEIGVILEYDFEKYLYEYKPYLTKTMISDLISNGFYIGGHGIDHTHLGQVSTSIRDLQVINSIKYLSELLHLNNNFFAFPYGSTGINLNELILNHKEIDYFFDTLYSKRDHSHSIIQRFVMDKNENILIEHVLLDMLLKKRIINKMITLF